MVDRLEFTKKVKLEIVMRAGGPSDIHCEGCGLPLRGKPFEIDHTIEEWERVEIQHGLRPPLTAADGKLLGKACCHQPKTALKAAQRAKGYRVREKHIGIKEKKRGGFNSDYKQKLDGSIVCKKTGKIIRGPR